MGSTVDQRVVEMRFDNAQFESNAATTLSTLDRIKEALNFSGIQSGFERITAAASRVNLSGVQDAIERVKSSFTSLEIVGITALSNITNQAMSMASTLASSLTIEPISQGFSEYETKMGSIQTIMANLSGTSSSAAASAAGSIASTASAASKAAGSANKQAQKDLKAAQKAETKAFETQVQAELKEYDKGAKEVLKNLEKEQSEQTKAIQDEYDDRLKALTKSQKEELNALSKSYQEQQKQLEAAQKEQLDTLKDAHNERLELYQEEYLAKVKTIDEERYNELKAIQDQIDALNALTEQENKAAKEKSEQEKKAALQQAADAARSAKKREETAKALDDFEQELATDRAQEERKQQIESLKDQMDIIDDLYDERVDAAKEEYSQQKQYENDLYNSQYDSLRAIQQAESEADRESYQAQLEALQERQAAAKEAMQEEYALEKAALQEQLQAEREALQEQQNAEREAIQDRRNDEKEAMQERQAEEMEAISAAASAAGGAVAGVQNSALGAVGAVKKAVKEVTLEDVNKALDELNEYADQTIYNFAEMTANIGRFTTAGVGLDDSVASIKGLSNIAALSGANSTQAAHAMQQLSQAIAAGTVRLMDWMSIENAGMGGKVFQESLMETARVHGIAIDQMLAEEGSFRNTLQKGWLSSDIMIETLRKFTNDLTDAELAQMGYSQEQIVQIQKQAQAAYDAATKVRTFTQLLGTMQEAVGSGWAKTFEILIGDFEEATELWTNLSNTFGAIIDQASDKRNQLLQGWKDAGGRDALIQGISNIWQGLQKVIVPVQKAFENLFPPLTVQQLVNFTKAFETLTAKFKMGSDTFDLVVRSLKGILSVVSIVVTGIKKLVTSLTPLIGIAGQAVRAILLLTAAIGDWLVGIDSALKGSAKLDEALAGIKNALTQAKNGLKGFVDLLLNWTKATFKSPSTDFITTFVDGVASGLSPIDKIFQSAVNTGNAFYGAFEKIFENVKLFVPVIGTIMNSVVNIVAVILGELPGVITSISDKVSEAIKWFANALKGALDGSNDDLSKPFEDYKNSFDTFIGYVETFVKKVKEVGTKVFNAIKNFVKNIIDNTDIVDLYQYLGLINSALFTSIIKSIADFVKGLADLSKNSPKILQGLTEIKDSLVNTINSLANDVKVDTLKAIALNIGVLAAAVYALSTIDGEKLKNTCIAVGAGLAELAMAMKYMDKLGSTSMKLDKEGFSKTSSSLPSTLRSFAIAMVGIAGSVKIISTIKPEDIETATNTMYAMATVLTGGVTIINAASSKFQGGSLDGLIGFAAAMDILVGGLKWVAGTPWEELEAGIKMMIGLASVLSGGVSVVYLASSKCEGGSLDGLIGFALAMDMLVAGLKWLSETPWDKMVNGAEMMAFLVAALDLSVAAIYAVSSKCSGGSLTGLIGFALAMDMLVGGLEWLANTPWYELQNGAYGMERLAGILVIGVAAIYLASSKCTGGSLAGLIGFALAMDMLVGGLMFLSTTPWDAMINGVKGMAGLAAILAVSVGGLAYATAGIDNVKMIATAGAMVIMAAAIDLLAPALIVLGKVPGGELAKAIAAIAAALIVMGVAAAAVTALGLSPALISLGASIALLGVGIFGVGAGLVAFAVGLQMLASVGTSTIGNFVASIRLLIEGFLNTIIDNASKMSEAAIAVVTAFCETLKTSAPMLGETLVGVIKGMLEGMQQNIPMMINMISMLIVKVMDALSANIRPVVSSIMGFVRKLISAVMEEIGKIDMTPFIKMFDGLGILSAMVVIIAGVGSLAGPAAVGIIGIGVVIKEFMSLMEILGLIGSIPGVQWLINKGGDFLAVLGSAIGKFVGGIAAGFTEGLVSTFPKIAVSLSTFMVGLDPFIYGASKINNDLLNNVKSLVEICLLLTGASLLDSLSRWFTGGKSTLIDFGAELAAFGPLFNMYYLSTKNIKSDAVQASATAAKTLAEFANNVPKRGGWVSVFSGENSLVTFANELKEFGPALMGYANSVYGLKSGAVTKSKYAVLSILEFADNVPERWGMISAFTGENSLTDFANELKDFGPALKDYADSVSGLKPETVKNSTTAAMSLVELSNGLKDHFGFIQMFKGDSSLSLFALELVPFGKAMKSYASSVDGINAGAVEASATAAKALAEVNNIIPEVGGLKSIWSGDESLTRFALSLVPFGKAMKSYAGNVDGITPSVVTESASAAKALAELNAIVPDSGGMKTLFEGDNTLKKFGTNIEDFGESFKNYADKVSGVNATNLGDVVFQVSRLVQLAQQISTMDTSKLQWFGNDLEMMGNQGIDGFIHAFEGCEKRIQDAVNTMAGYAKTALQEAGTFLYEPGAELGRQLMEGLDKGITDSNKTANALISVINMLKTTLKNNLIITDFLAAGQNIPNWIRDGINTTKSNLEAVIKNLCTVTVIQTMRLNLPVSTFKSIIYNVMTAIRESFRTNENLVLTQVNTMCNNIVNKTKTLLASSKFEPVGRQVVSGISSGIRSNSSAADGAISSLSSHIYNELNDGLRRSRFESMGHQIVNGITDGIHDYQQYAVAAARALAEAVAEAAGDALDIASPSKVFHKIGEYTVAGLILGIVDNLRNVSEVGTTMGTSLIDPVQEAINAVSEGIESSNSEFQPTITPVVDLSNVNNAARIVNSSFRGMQFGVSSSLAQSASSGFNYARYGTTSQAKEEDKALNSKLDKLANTIANTSKIENTNTFYIKSSDPKQAAEEVGYIMQHQVDRRKAAWAK